MTTNVRAANDSLRAEFSRNAKKINADLIRGDFCREREETYKAQISASSAVNLGLRAELAERKQSVMIIAESLSQTTQALNRATVTRRRSRLENWLWRGVAALTIYAKIRGL